MSSSGAGRGTAHPPETGEPTWDFIVVGSGFGGSVAALRLAEKRYRVLVLEAGRRWRTEELPRSNWQLRRYLWMPSLLCFGIQRLTLLKNMLVLSGAGVGGGSLVYANTLLVPPAAAFERGKWPRGHRWEELLAPHYETASRMLGVTRTPRLWAGDRHLRAYAEELGRESTFQRTRVGVVFGPEPGLPMGDPYFGGEGPERTSCTYCGACMVGCRHNAKNTLDKNYLYFAERLGAEIRPETRVTLLEPLAGGGFRVHVERSTRPFARHRQVLAARRVVLAAGALGTVNLLLRCREAGTLPGLPPALGRYVRTNSESICGATARDDRVDYSQGVAIASGFFPSPETYVEVVRYPRGSDAMALLATLFTGKGNRLMRPLAWLATCVRHPLDFLRSLNPFGWARRTTILLVMQSLESSLDLLRARRWWWPFRPRLTSEPAPGQPPVPTHLPAADRVARALAARVGGYPSSAVNEVLLDVPTTAHILGGACMASTPEQGVVGPDHRVFGYPDLYVVDGAAVPANLGVNPSLTITALAEHAMSQVPLKDPAAGLAPLPAAARAAAGATTGGEAATAREPAATGRGTA